MNRVPVVSKEGKPLMPTKPSKARKLVREGKATGKWNKLNQYYIQLTFAPSGEATQPIAVGVDPGKKYSGIGCVSSLSTLFTAHLFLPFETIKKRIEQRAMMRRGRRGRRTNRKLPFELRAHRQARFNNRRNKKVAPSIRANRQLEIKIVSELAKIYPVSTIVYEYVKAKTVKGCSFSSVQVGQKWAIKQLSKIAPLITKFGWQTSNLRKHLGLEKQKHSKGDAKLATHAVDGIALAASQFINYVPFHNSFGRGHYWKGEITITEAPFFVIRKPPISRRQLHLMVFGLGGKRRKYGGTTTRHGIRKGDYVVAERKNIKYYGWCSGDTKTQVSVSDSNWKRLGQFSKNKVQLLKRSTGLICTQILETGFPPTSKTEGFQPKIR